MPTTALPAVSQSPAGLGRRRRCSSSSTSSSTRSDSRSLGVKNVALSSTIPTRTTWKRLDGMDAMQIFAFLLGLCLLCGVRSPLPVVQAASQLAAQPASVENATFLHGLSQLRKRSPPPTAPPHPLFPPQERRPRRRDRLADAVRRLRHPRRRDTGGSTATTATTTISYDSDTESVGSSWSASSPNQDPLSRDRNSDPSLSSTSTSTEFRSATEHPPTNNMDINIDNSNLDENSDDEESSGFFQDRSYDSDGADSGAHTGRNARNFGLGIMLTDSVVHAWVKWSLDVLFDAENPSWPRFLDAVLTDKIPADFVVRELRVLELKRPQTYTVNIRKDGVLLDVRGVEATVRVRARLPILRWTSVERELTVHVPRIDFKTVLRPHILDQGVSAKSGARVDVRHHALKIQAEDLELFLREGIQKVEISDAWLLPGMQNGLVRSVGNILQQLLRKTLNNVIKKGIDEKAGSAIHELLHDLSHSLDSLFRNEYDVQLDLRKNFKLETPEVRLHKGQIDLVSRLHLQRVPTRTYSPEDSQMFYHRPPPKHWGLQTRTKKAANLWAETPKCIESRYAAMSWWKRMWLPWTWFRRYSVCPQDADYLPMLGEEDEGKAEVEGSGGEATVTGGSTGSSPEKLSVKDAPRPSKLLRCANAFCRWMRQRKETKAKKKEHLEQMEAKLQAEEEEAPSTDHVDVEAGVLDPVGLLESEPRLRKRSTQMNFAEQLEQADFASVDLSGVIVQYS